MRRIHQCPIGSGLAVASEEFHTFGQDYVLTGFTHGGQEGIEIMALGGDEPCAYIAAYDVIALRETIIDQYKKCIYSRNMIYL